MTLKGLRSIGFWLGAGLLVAANAPAASRYRKRAVKRVERAQQYLADVQEAPDQAIPAGLFRDCRGIIILRQYKAGFMIGAKGGGGIVLVKNRKTGAWSPPAFIKTGEGSIGFQIGGQSIDSIFLIMNENGVNMLLKTKFKIGVDASVAAGPVGRDAEAKVGPGTAILAYSRAKGLYAGATFEGGLLLIDGTLNEALYGEKGIGIKEILVGGKVKMPPEAKPLVRALKEYAGESEEEKTAPKEKKTGPAEIKKPKPPVDAPAEKKPAADKARADAEIAKKLKELKELRDQELITAEEYKKMRAEVLKKYLQ